MESWGEPRSKTVSWYDPMQTAAAASGLSGLEFLTAVAEKRLPNELATAKAGGGTDVVVWAKAGPGAERKAKLSLTGTSESDPSKSDHGTCRLP